MNEATGNLKGNLLIDVSGIINLRWGTQQKIKERGRGRGGEGRRGEESERVID